MLALVIQLLELFHLTQCWTCAHTYCCWRGHLSEKQKAPITKSSESLEVFWAFFCIARGVYRCLCKVKPGSWSVLFELHRVNRIMMVPSTRQSPKARTRISVLVVHKGCMAWRRKITFGVFSKLCYPHQEWVLAPWYTLSTGL